MSRDTTTEKQKLTQEKKAAQSKLHGRIDNEEFNPCYKEHLLSFKCMRDNNYDHDECKIYFENYKTCKKFWSFVQNDRRIRGISPNLPPVEERAKVKAEYLQRYA